MRSVCRIAVAAIAVVVGWSTTARADVVTINTGAPVGRPFQDFGPGACCSDPTVALPHGLIGQSFTVPTNVDFLTTFSFPSVTTLWPFQYHAYFEQWDPASNTAIGSVLYDTGPVAAGTFGVNFPSASTAPLVFNPQIGVTPGATYIVFLQTTGVYQAKSVAFGCSPSFPTDCTPLMEIGLVNTSVFAEDCTDPVGGPNALCHPSPDTYSGGSFFIRSRPYPFDASFTATFTTPEPSTLVLLAPGLAGIALATRRRKKK